MMDQDSSGYVDKILDWYVGLPDTPMRPSRYDRKLAIELCRRQVPLAVVESGFPSGYRPPPSPRSLPAFFAVRVRSLSTTSFP